MTKINVISLLIVSMITIIGCSKEQFVNVLVDQYQPTVKDPEPSDRLFVVSLSARALQPGETGKWKILAGPVVENYVLIVDDTNPFSNFQGIPGEEYTLEWLRRSVDGSVSSTQLKVRIPEPVIRISDRTIKGFETIKRLGFEADFKGKWTIEGKYAYLTTNAHDRTQGAVENMHEIDLHCYENTTYKATFTYNYAGKTFKSVFDLTSGVYTQDEGLYILGRTRQSQGVVVDRYGDVVELNLGAARGTNVLSEADIYPSLKGLSKLRKLVLNGSDLENIPLIIGDAFVNLEELSMESVTHQRTLPENFGNLTKLRSLLFTSNLPALFDGETTIPKSFANLKSLEHLTLGELGDLGFVNFNGTLGSLTKLKSLNVDVTHFPEDIGNLKALETIKTKYRDNAFPSSFSNCTELKFIRLTLDNKHSGEMVLPEKIGNLKKLETLEIFDNSKIKSLPSSFGQLGALKRLIISGVSLQSIPKDIGELSSMEEMELLGSFTTVPESLGNLKKLGVLSLGGKAEFLPESFGMLSNLRSFVARYSGFKILPKSIGKLKKLEDMDMSYSSLEELPASFGELDGLMRLSFAWTQLKTFPQGVISLKKIKQITLIHTSTADIPDAVSTMKKGVRFEMGGVPGIKRDQMERIVSIAPGIEFNTDLGFFSG